MNSTLSDVEILRLRNIEKKSLAEIGRLCGGISKVAVFKRLRKVNAVNLTKPHLQQAAKTETSPPQVNANQTWKCITRGVNGTRPKYLRQRTTGRIYVYNDGYAGRQDMEPYDGLLPGRG